MVACFRKELRAHMPQFDAETGAYTAADPAPALRLQHLVGAYYAGKHIAEERIEKGHVDQRRLREVHRSAVVPHPADQVRTKLGEWKLESGVGGNRPDAGIAIRRSRPAQH